MLAEAAGPDQRAAKKMRPGHCTKNSIPGVLRWPFWGPIHHLPKASRTMNLELCKFPRVHLTRFRLAQRQSATVTAHTCALSWQSLFNVTFLDESKDFYKAYTCYRSLSSFFTNHFEVLRRYMICRKVACLGSKILPTIVTDRCSCLRKSALQMTTITSNNRSVFGQIHYTNTKPPEHPLPTVGSSSGFNVTFLHDWSSFVLPKLMPTETVNRTHFLWCCIMVVSYQCSSKSYSLPLSQSGICRRQRSQKWTQKRSL